MELCHKPILLEESALCGVANDRSPHACDRTPANSAKKQIADSESAAYRQIVFRDFRRASASGFRRVALKILEAENFCLKNNSRDRVRRERLKQADKDGSKNAR
jgi:hypothetical protein